MAVRPNSHLNFGRTAQRLPPASETPLPENTVTSPAAPPRAARHWIPRLAPYRDPHTGRSLLEVAITLLPLAALCGAMWAALDLHYGLSLLLAVPAAAFLVRLFLIQHDCGHGAFFRNRAANDWTGRVIGVLTLTPYDVWRRSHAAHHATTGDLGRRGMGAITTLTVQEYFGASRRARLLYRLYRHPFVMFVLGPAHLFLLQHRWPVGYVRDGWLPWVSTMGTNAATAVLLTALVSIMGLEAFLRVWLPVMLLASSFGVWLFYVQHQFEGTWWRRDGDWDLPEASLHGSSHYDLPAPLRWVTANIGMHHLHHLSSRIPYYRLPRALRDHPELAAIGRVTLGESLRCVRLALWDEERRRLLSFAEARAAHERRV